MAGEVMRDGLFGDLEILEVASPDAAAPCRRAAAVAGQLAAQLGATVLTDAPSPRFGALGKVPRPATHEHADPVAWAAVAPHRILLVADVPDGAWAQPTGANVVRVTADPWHTEATLFAASGLADLFGHPDRAPLVPAGHWASATVAYAALAGLAALQALAERGDHDVAEVDCVDALRWVNWKSPAMAWVGAPITREGAAATWPVLACRDGFVAFVHTPRDWRAIVAMVGDPRLEDERFARGRDRVAHQDAWLAVVREWAATRSKAELDEAFHRHGVPGASVSTPQDLPTDPTLVHRGVFATGDVDGCPVPQPVAPLRIAAAASGTPRPATAVPGDALPLAGTRVLDLGVLTAGAGTSSLLADMGAEVIKIESASKPDMFRSWAGSDDSPLFHFSNRSKLGVDLDLKDPSGRAAFLALVATADAVIENFRRGVLERLDLGFEVLRAANPAIVLGSVSGQGLTGPRADHTTFGSTLEAMSGFSALTCDHEGIPMISGANLNYPDQTVCLFAGAAIAAAITRARATGTAMHLDISQRDVAVYAGASAVEASALGEPVATWEIVPGERGGWVAVGDGGREVPALDGSGVLEAARNDDASAIVARADGELVKGFPFTLVHRTMAVGGPAPAIGQHDDLVLGGLP